MNEKKMTEMQKNIRDNNEELQDFLLDMENWEKDMKDRDERLRKSASTSQQKEPKTKKQHSSKAKSQIKKSKIESTEEESDTSSESDAEELTELRRKQQGNEEKEMGNKLFKKGEWNKAIECYTRGLIIDPYNPLLSANRAMALLKIGSFAAAEADCNQCLFLDDTYVKAYLRRAAARYELQKYEQAKEDVKKVMDIEPANVEAKKLLKSLYQQHGKGSESDGQHSNKPDEEKLITEISKQPSTSKESSKKGLLLESKTRLPEVFTAVDSKFVISPVQKPPHLRSKVPLKKIVVELEKDEAPLKLGAPWSSSKRCDTAITRTKDIEVVNQPTRATETKESTSIPPCPKSFNEFQRGWEKVYAVTNVAFKYLTQIPADCYPRMFGDLLESDVLSQMLHVLSRGAADEAVQPLRALTTVSRFTMLKLFMSVEDKKAVQRILDCFCSSDGLSEQLSNAYLS